jgi:hypothetical protein
MESMVQCDHLFCPETCPGWKWESVTDRKIPVSVSHECDDWHNGECSVCCDASMHCAHCGECGARTGHMECSYPR